MNGGAKQHNSRNNLEEMKQGFTMKLWGNGVRELKKKGLHSQITNRKLTKESHFCKVEK